MRELVECAYARRRGAGRAPAGSRDGGRAVGSATHIISVFVKILCDSVSLRPGPVFNLY